jgi:hypothetical protein
MVTSPLKGVRVKIDRAKKHLSELDRSIRAFEALHPYSVMPDKKSEPSYVIDRFWLNVDIPDEWAAVLGDCVHNLRSALDLLAVALVEANGGTPGDHTSFPVESATPVGSAPWRNAFSGPLPNSRAAVSGLRGARKNCRPPDYV